MGFFGSALSAIVKTAITPVAIVKDVVDVASGKEANNTKNLIDSAIEDVEDAADSIS